MWILSTAMAQGSFVTEVIDTTDGFGSVLDSGPNRLARDTIDANIAGLLAEADARGCVRQSWAGTWLRNRADRVLGETEQGDAVFGPSITDGVVGDSTFRASLATGGRFAGSTSNGHELSGYFTRVNSRKSIWYGVECTGVVSNWVPMGGIGGLVRAGASIAGQPWVAGEVGLVRQYRGGTWVEHDVPGTPDLRGIGGSDDGQVWVVGEHGVVLGWDGSDWTSYPTGTGVDLRGVDGLDADTAFAVGDQGTLLAWDGSGWSPVPLGITDRLLDVHLLDATHGWAFGTDIAFSWDGAVWSPMPAPGGPITSVWAAAPDDLWAADLSGTVHRFDGTSWSSEPAPGDIHPVRVVGEPGGDVWVLGLFGGLARWDGGAWTVQVVEPPDDLTFGLIPVDGGVWAVGAGFWVRGDASGVEVLSESSPHQLHGLHVQDAENLWFGGLDGRIYHWDGHGAHPVELDPLSSLFGFTSFGPDDAWAHGRNGTLVHFDGATWTPVAGFPGGDINHLWGTSSDDFWTAGDQGQLRHWNGSVWTTLDLPGSPDLDALHGTASDDVWAGGLGGTLQHWDGSTWTPMPSPTTKHFVSMAFASPELGWAGTQWYGEPEEAELWRWDGVGWTLEPLSLPHDSVTELWAEAPDRVWMATGSGQIWYFDGSTWERQFHDPGLVITGFSGLDQGALWAVGTEGRVVRGHP